MYADEKKTTPESPAGERQTVKVYDQFPSVRHSVQTCRSVQEADKTM